MKAFRFDKCGLERWYFVCNRCDAKWFSSATTGHMSKMPELLATSTDALIPPWLLPESTPPHTDFRKGISQ